MGIRGDGRYYAAVVCSCHHDHERDDVAMTIQVAGCLSDIQALTELYRSSLALVNNVRELCEDEAGNFASWRDIRIP